MTTVGYSIPVDLIIEILLKLPGKSVLRFKSVSKSWCSIINSQEFINASSQPRLVLAFHNRKDDRLLFFSSPHQSCSFSSSSSSMLVAKKYTLRLPKVDYYNIYIINSVRGFVCCFLSDRYVVCNPTTGQVINLEKNHNCSRMYLGYDPNSDKYKVLRIMPLKSPDLCFEYSVRTLGSSDDSWRSIKRSIHYDLSFQYCICIDGVVYYRRINIQNGRRTLGIFDVGFELLRFIEAPEDKSSDIANYMGKCAVYCCIDNGFNLWVLDDVKNQVWSKKTYVFPIGSKLWNWRFRGITVYGELVFVPLSFSDPFELVCYDVKKKVERSVRLEGLSDVNLSVGCYCSLLCSYVNNFMFL